MAYVNQLTPYNDLQAVITEYQNGTKSIGDVLSAYAIFTAEVSDLTAITTARNDALNKGAAIVTALAYEQLWYAQSSANTISTDAATLLANDKVTASAKATIQSILDQLSSLQSTLSSAFLNYRHSVYDVATAQATYNQAVINFNIAFCQNSAELLSDADLTAANTAMTDAQTALASAQSDETSYKAALDSAISAINTAYATIKNLGAGLSSTSTPPIEDVEPQVEALEAAYEKQKTYLTQSSVTRQIATASTITLPSTSSSLSMVQLMALLGEAQVMSIEVARRSALSSATVNAYRSQATAMNLLNVATDIGGLLTLATEIQQIVDNYNSQIETLNAQMLATAEAEYNFFANNIATINSIITATNTAYQNNDAATKALLDAASGISQATLDAAYSESLSETLSESYLLSSSPPTQVPGAFPTATTYTSIAYLTGSDFVTFNANTTLSDVNSAFAALLEKIAPILPQIETALSGMPGAPSDLSLSPKTAYSTYPTPPFLPSQSTIDQLSLIFSTYSTQEASTSDAGESQDTIEANQLLRLLALFGQGLNVTSSGALASLSSGAGAGSAAAAAALSQIGASSIFLNTIQSIFTNAAMLAGLQLAGSTPEIMAKLAETKMTLAEYLEAQATQAGAALDATTQAELANAMLQQLAVLITTPGALQAYAASILQGSPELANLSEADKTAVLSGLVSVLESVIVSAMVVIGISQGLSAASLISMALGTETTATSTLAAQFTALGIPMQKATELASMIAGQTGYSRILEDMNLDATTRAEILALVAAHEGNISLSSGVPGGKAFLATIIQDLASKGIVLPADISSPDFISTLVLQLQAKATPEQAVTIQQTFLPTTVVAPVVSGTTSTLDLFMQAATQTESALKALLETPVTEAGNVLAVSPSSILNQFVTQFEALSPTTQQALISQVANNSTLATLPGMTNEQVAALMLATRLGAVTPAEASSLIALVQAQAAAAAQNLPLTLSNLETKLVTNLFTPTEEERRIQEEAVKTEKLKAYIAPSTLSPLTLDSVSSAFRQYFVDMGDRTQAAKSIEAFAQTTQKVTDFPKVAAQFLTSPGLIILRTYSLRTRLAQDRGMQQDVTMTG
jgi:hypothetical protein